MDAKKRIDKILTAVHGQVQEEIGVLLGVDFSLSGVRNALVSRQEFFDSLAGKQIVARIDLTGEVEGAGCLVVGIKDAIRLGGTLIMLPDNELEEVVGREEYGGETEDSYGEIANIIAGAYTKTFEEMYSKAFRFVRKEQQIVVPSRVQPASPEPIPEQSYYQVSCFMKLEGRQMGEIHMLMPAVSLGLQPPEPVREQTPDQVGEKPAAVSPAEGRDGAREPAAASSKAMDPDKQKGRIDKLLESCEKRISTDLSSLLGAEVTFSGIENRLISKEELFFDELENKQLIADMELAGEFQGRSYLFAGLKDAIRLGGILIMLPPMELENVVADEEFGDDVRDAFGEIANIVSGVYSSAFEEQYPQRVRFIRKELRQVVPVKVDIGSDEPIPDQQYYMSSMALQADGETLGKVRMLFPAALFRLDQLSVSTVESQAALSPTTAADKAVAGTAPAAAGHPDDRQAPAADRGPRFDVEKHRKRVDKLLKECCRKAQEEVAALLGTEITLDELENRHVSKADFFLEVANGKQVIANLDVVGELTDRSYLCVSLKDAIHLGGVLIMLPPTELEEVIVDEEFGDDTRDAYGEIANIISGVYTAVFEQQYSAKIRFVRSNLGIVVPMKVDIDSDEPVPEVEYYMSSMTLGIEGQRKGRVHLLFPAAMLKLESSPVAEPAEEAANASAAAVRESGRAEAADDGRTISAAAGSHVPVDILLISDDELETAKISAVAREQGLSIRQVSFKDNIKSALTRELQAVYIVMREVGEQAFGMAIKVSSSCSLPIIAAGPAWTRSKVIKAVRYGVNDILLTPATTEDIEENLRNNLVRMAA